MMFCTECGKDVRDDAWFCPSCGKALRAKDEGTQPAKEAPGEDQPEATEEQPEPDPGPHAQEAPEPSPAIYETAREGAAHQMAAESAASEPPPAAPEETEPEVPPVAPAPTAAASVPRPVVPPAPEPVIGPIPTPTDRPTPPPAAPMAQQPPTPTPPPSQQPPTIPPTAPPTPPAGEAPAPGKGGGGKWCLIGCGILLVLGILAAIAFALIGRWASKQADGLPESVTNQLEIWEPDGDAPANAEGEGGSLAERLGEAAQGLSTAVSGAQIEGFEPTSVDAALLPTFYGFMIALADDSPHGMYAWMSPQYKEEWSPESWTVAENLEHVSYVLSEQTPVGEDTMQFSITETVRTKDTGEESDLDWIIEFKKINNQWYVTDFE
ncbi:MAG: zinc-ribbon domain-containing protein [candidate division WS1 bacterium]|nr:zinc-ribbon domain-containing protein [candidate division WS1 bacterium]